MIAHATPPRKLTPAIIASVARSLEDGTALAMARGLIAIAQSPPPKPMTLDEWNAMRRQVWK